MRCSNCGKETPFAGKVCHWCGADKSKDQMQTSLAGFLGLVGGAIGYFIGGIVAGIFGFVFGCILGFIAAEKMNNPSGKISAVPKVLLLLVFVLFIWCLIPSSKDSGGETNLSPSSEQQASPHSSSSSAVESLSANWLLAKQANRNRETMQELTDAKQRGDMEAFNRILRVRSAELAQVIDEVNSGSYSVSDKQKMLVPLEQEKDWADASVAALSQ